MAGNKNLNAANKAKKDEFYTQLDDIANELKHYRQHFRDKDVLCNCDDPYESNFFKYFALNFNSFGLKKLIATCYNGSPITGSELPLLFELPLTSGEGVGGGANNPKKIAYKVEITEVKDCDNDGAVNLADVQYLIQNNKNVLSLLKGNGDFRSAECVELLKQAEIVVTNPPFSLFREYVAKLMEYDKKFLIIGNQNAIHYKDIFTFLKNNQIWLGVKCGDMGFRVPQHYEERNTRFWIDEQGNKWRSLGNICWFTNLDIAKRHEEMILYRTYSAEDYPKYDNYDAINVDKTADIPCDYDGVMGVPVTFMDKYNPEQFDIIDTSTIAMPKGAPYINGKRIYERILIRRKR